MERRKKMEMNPQILAQELVIEILLRLPVKSLICFKSVCKSWLSLISDPQFAKSHFDLALAPTQRILLLDRSISEIVSVDINAPSFYDDSSFTVVKPLPFHLPIVFLGSCRGFILLHCSPNRYIWNLSTGVHTELPSPVCCAFSKRDQFFTYLFGFGYDPSTDDYLVLACGQVFSSRDNTWKQLKDSHLCGVDYTFMGITCEVGLHFAGGIHWLAYDCHRSVGVIIVFDVIERVFSEIALPNDLDFNHDLPQLLPYQLCVIAGFLCVCSQGYKNIGSGIWVMKEYKVQSSWTRSHFPCSSDFYPVCCTKDGNIVGIGGYKELVKFNDKGVVLEHRCFSDYIRECFRFDVEFGVALHTESLLSLPTAR